MKTKTIVAIGVVALALISGLIAFGGCFGPQDSAPVAVVVDVDVESTLDRFFGPTNARSQHSPEAEGAGVSTERGPGIPTERGPGVPTERGPYVAGQGGPYTQLELQEAERNVRQMLERSRATGLSGAVQVSTFDGTTAPELEESLNLGLANAREPMSDCLRNQAEQNRAPANPDAGVGAPTVTTFAVMPDGVVDPESIESVPPLPDGFGDCWHETVAGMALGPSETGANIRLRLGPAR